MKMEKIKVHTSILGVEKVREVFHRPSHLASGFSSYSSRRDSDKLAGHRIVVFNKKKKHPWFHSGLPKIAQDHLRLPYITQDLPRLLKIPQDHTRFLKIVQDRPRLPKITQNHPRSPKIAQDHIRSPKTSKIAQDCPK